MLYIACIMSFVWRTSAQDTNSPGDLSKGGLLAAHIVITVVLGFGMLYGWLILSAFRITIYHHPGSSSEHSIGGSSRQLATDSRNTDDHIHESLQ